MGQREQDRETLQGCLLMPVVFGVFGVMIAISIGMGKVTYIHPAIVLILMFVTLFLIRLFIERKNNR